MTWDWFDSDTLGLLGRGVGLTVILTVITSAASLSIGLIVGVLRMARQRVVRGLAAAYIELFRNVPALIQIIFWAFAVPTLFPSQLRSRLFFNNPLVDWISDLSGLSLPYYALAAAIGLSLNTSAYLAELFRAGAGTIPTVRLEAARTLGASPRAIVRTIIIPDSLRASFPAISNRLVHNMKNTALASFVAVPELFHEMQAAINDTFRATELLLATAVLYLVLAVVMSVLLHLVDRRLHRGRDSRGKEKSGQMVANHG